HSHGIGHVLAVVPAVELRLSAALDGGAHAQHVFWKHVHSPALRAHGLHYPSASIRGVAALVACETCHDLREGQSWTGQRSRPRRKPPGTRSRSRPRSPTRSRNPMLTTSTCALS